MSVITASEYSANCIQNRYLLHRLVKRQAQRAKKITRCIKKYKRIGLVRMGIRVQIIESRGLQVMKNLNTEHE